MIRVTFASLLSRKRRLLGTAVAVVTGVAFLTATLALGDTARAGFADAFTEANEGVDAVVRSTTRLTGAEDVVQGPVDAAVLDTVLAVDGVGRAEPMIEGIGQMLDSDGVPIGGQGPPTLAGNWITEPSLNPYQLAEGAAPAGPGEVVIDRGTAIGAGFAVGDPVTILMPEPTSATIVGIATFGQNDNLGGITQAFFTTAEAQRLLFDGEPLLTSVRIAASEGTGEDELVEALGAVLPAGVQAITGSELVDELQADIESDFLGFFTAALLVFAGVAMLVAALTIYNTFSILAAQRTTETALLRAIGASRRQVLVASAVESLVVGLVGGVVGVVTGLGLGAALAAGLDAAGFGLPIDGMRLDTASVVTALSVGVLVTLLAGLVPAIRASRVAPLAALRDATIDRSGRGLVRLLIGFGLAAVGTIAVLSATAGDGNLSAAGAGALAMVVGVVLLGPIVARPVAALLGAPFAASGVTGTLAKRNATRNPSRTAGTASALLVGVGVVTLFTVFASSIATTVEEIVDESFAGDLVVEAGGFSGAGLPDQLPASLEALPEVQAASGFGLEAGRVDGRDELVTVIDPATFGTVFEFGADPSVVTGSGLAISEGYADDHDLAVGDEVSVTFTDGASEALTVQAVLASQTVGFDVMVPASVWSTHSTGATLVAVIIELADGVSIAEGKQAVTTVTEPLGAPEVADRDEFVDSEAAEVRAVLNVIYGLLLVAIVIAVLGITNTLSLSIHERTRELGLLRAVGQSRRQLRAMVRMESVVVATFGACGGLGVGIFLGWGLVRALEAAEGFGTFHVPVVELLVILVLGAAAGVIAALRPASRAARLDVLGALATSE